MEKDPGDYNPEDMDENPGNVTDWERDPDDVSEYIDIPKNENDEL